MRFHRQLEILTSIFFVFSANPALSKTGSLAHSDNTTVLYKSCVFKATSDNHFIVKPDASAIIKKNCADLYDKDITYIISDKLENLSLSAYSQTILGPIAEIKLFNRSNMHITKLCIAISEDDSNFIKLCGVSAGYVIDPNSDGSVEFLNGFPVNLGSKPYWHVISVFGF